MWIALIVLLLVVGVNLMVCGFATPWNFQRTALGWAFTLRVLPGWYLGLSRITQLP
jgi:hypothetical protein